MTRRRTAVVALGALVLAITPAAAALRGSCEPAPRFSVPVATGALVTLVTIGSALAP